MSGEWRGVLESDLEEQQEEAPATRLGSASRSLLRELLRPHRLSLIHI